MDYGAIGIGAGVAGAIFAGLAWSLSGRTLKYQMLAELMREYAHPDIGKAVEMLWDYYRENEKNSDKVAEDFQRRLEKRKKQAEGDELRLRAEAINEYRRQLAHFYHRMAALHEGHALPDKVLYRIWNEESLQIVPEIIIPLEKGLIKWRNKEDNKEKEEIDSKVFELLLTLYRDSTKPGMTLF